MLELYVRRHRQPDAEVGAAVAFAYRGTSLIWAWNPVVLVGLSRCCRVGRFDVASNVVIVFGCGKSTDLFAAELVALFLPPNEEGSVNRCPGPLIVRAGRGRLVGEASRPVWRPRHCLLEACFIDCRCLLLLVIGVAPPARVELRTVGLEKNPDLLLLAGLLVELDDTSVVAADRLVLAPAARWSSRQPA